MSSLQKYLPSFASALLMFTVLFIIYPHYQYYIDPDGTAYLTISQRYANGDYARAINGYWSPWACWLTALLIKQGLAPIPASVIINTMGATGFLFITQSFFLRFNITARLQWLFNITVALFLCFAIFWQSFDDLWECFFLLSTLRLMLADNFKSRPALWVLSGFLGALAYFAKSYAFPFFILNTVCCTWFICRDNKGQWLKISFTAITVMILCSLPWIWQLHQKYGIWTTSTAGPLNTSWYLVGHPYWKDGIGALLPPVYPDSPYYWEDPWVVNGQTPHFWDSWHLFGLQILRIGLNLWKFIISSLELSVFFIAIVGYVKWKLIWRRKEHIDGDLRILMWSLLLFPLGYVLVNFESRYIWYMLPLGMVIGSIVLQNTKWKNVLYWVFPVTFLIYPAWGMIKMYDEGKDEYTAALQFRQLGIKGSFTTYPIRGILEQRMRRLAYLSGMQFYSIPHPDSCSMEDIYSEIKRYQINYLFKYGHHTSIQLPDGRYAADTTNGKLDALSVFLVDP